MIRGCFFNITDPCVARSSFLNSTWSSSSLFFSCSARLILRALFKDEANNHHMIIAATSKCAVCFMDLRRLEKRHCGEKQKDCQKMTFFREIVEIPSKWFALWNRCWFHEKLNFFRFPPFFNWISSVKTWNFRQNALLCCWFHGKLRFFNSHFFIHWNTVQVKKTNEECF